MLLLSVYKWDDYTKFVDAQFIITRNTADFVSSQVPAVTPNDFLIHILPSEK